MWVRSGCAVVFGLLMASTVHAGVIDFDKDEYWVSPGAQEEFVVSILFDGDESTPGLQAPNPGLLTAGVKVLMPGDLAEVVSDSDIEISPIFQGNGVGGPPVKTRGNGLVGFFAGMELGTQTGFRSTTLVTLHITDRAKPSDYPYTLALAPYSAQGAIIDIDENLLDPGLTLGTATVMPEPASGVLLGLGLAWALRRRR